MLIPTSVGVSTRPVTPTGSRLDAASYASGLVDTHLALMRSFMERMKHEPAQRMRQISAKEETRRAHKAAFGKGPADYSLEMAPGYQRTHNLVNSWHMTRAFGTIRVWNNAKEGGRVSRGGHHVRGHGRPYAVWAYGTADGEIKQAHQMIDAGWPSLHTEWNKYIPAFRTSMEQFTITWAGKQIRGRTVNVGAS